jgi:hypothetical protein
MNNKPIKKMEPVGDIFIPIEKSLKNKKIHRLLDNPPRFDFSNKSEIKLWLKQLVNLIK